MNRSQPESEIMIKTLIRVLPFAALIFADVALAKVPRPPQFVVMAFDGSKSVDFWKASRAFAQSQRIHFTYFVSGVYFLANADRNKYVEPSKGKGKSAIGFGGSATDIGARLEQMKLAMKEGLEMASHANGHYDGSLYSQRQWNSEFEQLTRFMSYAWDNYAPGREPAGWKIYFASQVAGFRAPLLGVGNRKGLWPNLISHRFSYDTSLVEKPAYWPKKVDGIWKFPLVGLTIFGTNKKTLSMDYNFYYAQSGAIKGPESEFQRYEDEMFKTYMAYLNTNYYGNRAPLHIGHHFSLWNGGAYWKALQRFAKEVCNSEAYPEVKCVTYKELQAFLESNKDSIVAYEMNQFDMVNAPPGVSMLPELSDDDLRVLRSLPNDPPEAHDEE